jgi:D-glycero-D-manno-heptose 1,7-bisphosphate phosphatase
MNNNDLECHLTEAGLWSEVLSPRTATEGRAALFLDRDGVLVEEVNYLHRPQDARLIDGAVDVISRANAQGIAVVIVTNQAGIGRRYYDWNHFIAVQAKITEMLGASGVHLDGVFACPHHADARPPYQHPDHPARKPNPGMILLAGGLLGLDLAASWIIGDRSSDVRAGLNGGLAGGVQVATGHGSRGNERDTARALATDSFPVHCLASIAGVMAQPQILDGALI